MSLGSKAVGDEFVNGQERSFAARKQHITNLKRLCFSCSSPYGWSVRRHFGL